MKLGITTFEKRIFRSIYQEFLTLQLHSARLVNTAGMFMKVETDTVPWQRKS